METNVKTKAVEFGGSVKTKEIDGERRIVFVASSNELDRHGERVDVESLRLPVKGTNATIRVGEIPPDGVEGLDIPLMLDHSVEVQDVIGSVRRAFYSDGELIFEAGISSREIAQEVLTLLEEEHLSNAFSLTMTGFDYDSATDTISNAEVVEVSVVNRGANREARLLAVKALIHKDEQAEQSEAIESARPAEEKVETETAKAETEPRSGEKEADAVEAPSGESPEENTNVNEEKAMDTEIAKDTVEKKAEVVQITTDHRDYLSTAKAMHDFAKTIVATKGMSGEATMKAWADSVKSKGITGDEILPTELESIFFKNWYDQTGPLGTFRNLRAPATALYAITGSGEGIRAKGHKKGEQKADQEVATIRRDLKAKLIYKRLPIDLQDLIDDTTGEITRFRAEELTLRVAAEQARGAVLGDGREAPASGSADYRVFDGTRGLFSMKADLDAAADAANNPYAATVAVRVANTAGDNLYDKIRKTAGAIRDEARAGKVVVVETGSLTGLELTKDSDGRYIFQPGTNLEALLGYTIVEMDGVADSGYDVIAYTRNQYAMYSTGDMIRTWFDGNINADYMLAERSTAGSLYGYRAAAGYVSAE